MLLDKIRLVQDSIINHPLFLQEERDAICDCYKAIVESNEQRIKHKSIYLEKKKQFNELKTICDTRNLILNNIVKELKDYRQEVAVQRFFDIIHKKHFEIVASRDALLEQITTLEKTYNLKNVIIDGPAFDSIKEEDERSDSAHNDEKYEPKLLQNTNQEEINLNETLQDTMDELKEEEDIGK